MTADHPNPWTKLGEVIAEQIDHAGRVIAATTALSELINGNQAAAAGMLDSLPDDALQPTLDAAALLAGLLVVKGRSRGLDMHDPTQRLVLPGDPPCPA